MFILNTHKNFPKNNFFFLPTDPLVFQHVTGNKQFILLGLIINRTIGHSAKVHKSL